MLSQVHNKTGFSANQTWNNTQLKSKPNKPAFGAVSTKEFARLENYLAKKHGGSIVQTAKNNLRTGVLSIKTNEGIFTVRQNNKPLVSKVIGFYYENMANFFSQAGKFISKEFQLPARNLDAKKAFREQIAKKINPNKPLTYNVKNNSKDYKTVLETQHEILRPQELKEVLSGKKV